MKWAIMYMLSLVFISCNNNSDKNYEASKETILSKEEREPLRFLKVSHTDKRNLVGQTVVKGTISSSASMGTYKNIRIKMLYYNTDGELVTNHEEVIDKVIQPQGEVKFTARYGTPRGTDSVAVSIMSAEVVKDKQ